MPRPGEVARSLLFYLAFYGGTVALLLAAMAMLPLSQSAFRAVVRTWSRWHRWCARWLLGIRVKTIGEVPREPVLIAIKHESFFEAIDLPSLLHFPAVFLKAELARLPLWGFASRHWGNIAVERSEGAKALRAMRAAALERTAEGRPLVIFPEGTRVAHGSGPPLQSGFAGLYKLLGLPVVPVAVDSGPLYHRRWKGAGTITLRFGEPLPPGLPRAEIEARVHAAINALNGPAAR
jgi:1-acyl-sn-glycerol-3-phosphate acyltransferase